MRGIETSLRIFKEVNSEGAFASEALRKVYAEITPADRKLAATLVYCSLRRQGLWRHLLTQYSRRDIRDVAPVVYNALIVGIAGIIELKHFALPMLVNGVIQSIKAQGAESSAGFVNAILHTVAKEAPADLADLKKSSALRDQALYWGVPGWAAAQWSKDSSIAEAKRLVRAIGMKTYLSLRVSDENAGADWIDAYGRTGRIAWKSPWLPGAVRTAANPYPLGLPGYDEGRITPQSESSIFIGRTVAKHYKGGAVLDMCCGRGVKTGQLASLLPDAEIEAWDLSMPRVKAAEQELLRLGVRDRVVFRAGDALLLMPQQQPSLILLDAPCSGSGTWGRHPEGKWRVTPEMVAENAVLQNKLLAKAISIVAPGGVIAYSTCSIFKEENEKIVASVMAKFSDIVEIPVARTQKFMSKGKPWGTTIWPALPWVDGFYISLLAKKKQSR